MEGISALNKTCRKFGVANFPPHTVVPRDPKAPVTGWMIDFADILAKKLDFCYEIVRPDSIGFKLPNGTYTGLTGLLNRQEIDMSITPLAITPFRLEAYDFSTYIYFDQQQLIAKRPKAEADITGFVKPFPAMLWGLVFGATLFCLVVIFFLLLTNSKVFHKRRPKSHSDGPSPLKDSATEGKNYLVSKEIQISFLWTISSLLSMSYPWNPQSVSMRTITGVWLIFCLIISTLYKSTLQSMLILPIIKLPFTSVEDILGTRNTIFLVEGSLMAYAVKEAPENSLLGRLRKQTITHFNSSKAIDQTFAGEIVGFSAAAGHLSLMHSDFSRTGQCHLFVTHKHAMFKGNANGLPIPPGSAFLPKVNKIITNLREFGIIDHLFKNSMSNASECLKPITATVSADSLRPLELKDFYGVFSIYLGGLALGMLIFAGEVIGWHLSSARQQN